MTISWLLAKMVEFGNNTALVWRNKEYSYANLLECINFWRYELTAQGIDDINVVSLEGDYSLNSCALLLALTESNKIIVPITKAAKQHKHDFIEIAEVQAQIEIDSQDKWIIRKIGRTVTNDTTRKLIHLYNPGLVLFSSGSTGKPKGVLHDLKKILEKYKIPRNKMRTLNFLLFDHIGGINTLFYTLSNGGAVITTSSRNPERICQLIQRYKIELLPTTPTFLNLLLLSEVYKDYDLSSLNLITYGTEMMSESVLKRLSRVFPNVRLLQTYGLSELGILRSKSKGSNSLWVRVGGEGFETKVVDGILWIRADSAMVGYLNAPNPFTDDGWFVTGDAVDVDGDYIRILGRDSDIINVGGEKVYPAEVESILQMMDGVQDVAVWGENNPLLGQIVRAKVNLSTSETAAEFRKRMKVFCGDKLPRYKIPQKVIIASKQLHNERFKKIHRI